MTIGEAAQHGTARKRLHCCVDSLVAGVSSSTLYVHKVIFGMESVLKTTPSNRAQLSTATHPALAVQKKVQILGSPVKLDDDQKGITSERDYR